MRFHQVTYLVDHRSRILSVGGEWLEFAEENATDLPAPSALIGTRLTGHVAGRETQQALERIFLHALETQRSFRLPYRCDSPLARRDYFMTVTPIVNARFLVTHDQIDEQSLPSPHGLSRHSADAEDCKCSFCCAVLQATRWIDPVDSLRDQPPAVRYVVCPDCRDQIERECSRLRAARSAG